MDTLTSVLSSGLFLIFAGGLFLLLWSFVVYFKAYYEIKAAGYDVGEVGAFLKATNWDHDDFINSKGVRIAYAHFLATGSVEGEGSV